MLRISLRRLRENLSVAYATDDIMLPMPSISRRAFAGSVAAAPFAWPAARLAPQCSMDHVRRHRPSAARVWRRLLGDTEPRQPVPPRFDLHERLVGCAGLRTRANHHHQRCIPAPPPAASTCVRTPNARGLEEFPGYLRDAGYYCTNNAKEDYNLEKPPGTWDESSKDAHWRKRGAGQPFFSVFNDEITHESQIRKRPQRWS